jgi:hypothetical protein
MFRVSLPICSFSSLIRLTLTHTTVTSIANMRLSTVALTSLAAKLAAASTVSFPLANGFPDLNTTALVLVNQLAGGTQPTGPASTFTPTFTDAGIQTLRLIAANELAEVAFFSQLVSNITNSVANYQCDQYVLDSLISILNVSRIGQLHFPGVC